MNDNMPTPAESTGCPKCERTNFTSASGKTLHIKACTGAKPAPIAPPGESCPRCGRMDFTSSSGRTLHFKSCKGSETQIKLETPCPECGVVEFNSLSGRTLHINACKEAKNPQTPSKPQETTSTPCPKCGRLSFNSLSGRTLHIKSCTVEIITTDVEIPCPKCGTSDFNSASGRTLHIKSCTGQGVELKKIAYGCVYCDETIYGYEKTIINHLDECYPIIKNEKGHLFDKHLEIWVKKAPSTCHAPKSLSSVLQCKGIVKLGIRPLNHHDYREGGCWLEGIGACGYSFRDKGKLNHDTRVNTEMTDFCLTKMAKDSEEYKNWQKIKESARRYNHKTKTWYNINALTNEKV